MKAITVGVFDLLHFGHFELFRRARDIVGDGGELIVAVQDDAWVTKFKPVKLVYTWEQRAAMISAIRYVTRVVSYTAVNETLKQIEFDIFICGPDQNHTGFEQIKQWCIDHGRKVVELPRTEGVSTSLLKTIIKNS